MGKLVYVTGGARSGKSTFAENMIKDSKQVVYIATSIPCDEEMVDRIKKHQNQRPKNWITIESFKDIDKDIGKLENKSTDILLDCITIMITNLMFESRRDYDTLSMDEINYLEKEISDQIDKVIKLKDIVNGTIIIVSNELGMGLVPEYRLSRIFRDIAGRMNQKLAKASDEAYLIVSGLQIKLK